MLSEQDFKTVKKAIGREPNELEQALFLNMWSEHCSYRSSGALLKNFSSKSDDVVIGPGDDAAIVKFDDEYVVSIAMESHNHPSYIEPFAGAATGVGGIVRDIISMGTKPMAVMAPLYIGPLSTPKNVWLFQNILKGAADYSEKINVSAIRGEIYFHEGYSGNPLVNVVAVGVGRYENIMTSVSKEAGNRLVLYGAKTGMDGLGGASFASKNMSEGDSPAESSIPTGDPELEARVIEATIEAIQEGLFQSCRDLGAAGLAGATAELAGKNGGFGAVVTPDVVPLRADGMGAYEIMLSESQERMLAEVRPKDLNRVFEIMRKHDIPVSDVGFLTEDPAYKIIYKGKTVADLPVDLVTNGVEQIILPEKEPAPRSSDVIHKKPECRDIKQELLDLISTENLASKEPVWSCFGKTIQDFVVTDSGEDAGIIMITDKAGLAMTCGCEPGIGLIDPYAGASNTVVGNAMNLAVKGALGLCAVDNLNFGNPYDPVSYWILKQSVLGLSDTFKQLNIPVVGGNVSLYNVSEEFQTTIPPTPSIGMIGKVNIDKKIPLSYFKEEGDVILLIGETKPEMAGSEYYLSKGFPESGAVPNLPKNYNEIIKGVAKAAASGLVNSARSISRGGIGIALAEMVTDVGAEIDLSHYALLCSYKPSCKAHKMSEDIRQISPEELLFSESPARAILTTKTPEKVIQLLGNIPCTEIGKTTGYGNLIIKINGNEMTATKKEIKKAASSLEKYMVQK